MIRYVSLFTRVTICLNAALFFCEGDLITMIIMTATYAYHILRRGVAYINIL